MLKRCAIFIDGNNIYRTFFQAYRDKGHIDYTAIVQFFAQQQGYDVLATLLMRYDPNNPSQQEFIKALSMQGFRLLVKEVETLPDGQIRGDMDIDIAVEIFRIAPSVDVIVLVSGDGDFEPLIHEMARNGKEVWVLGPPRFTSKKLIHASHYFVSLENIPNILQSGRN